MYNPYNYKAVIILKTAFRQFCEGVPMEDLELTPEREGILRSFQMAASTGKSALQISEQTKIPSTLCAELKCIQRSVRRVQKEKNTHKIEPTLAEILKYHLRGLSWYQISLKGAKGSPCLKVQKFLAEIRKNSSEEELRNKLKLSEIEVQILFRVLKENQKVVA